MRAPRATGQRFSFLQVPRMIAQRAWKELRKAFWSSPWREHSQVTGTKIRVLGDGVTLQEGRIAGVQLGEQL